MLKTAKPSSPQRPAPVKSPVVVASEPKPRRRESFLSITLALGLAGSLLLWAAFPPVDLPWLAWIAPAAWLWLARRPDLPGRWPYIALWLAGFVHWLAMVQGIRLAHPALYAGWIALAAYLGAYLPVFVGLTRIAVHRLNLSLLAAAPVVWVGLELLRGHLITGFSLGLLAHTQAELPLLIQVCDLGGGYVLSFVIMLVAACATRMLPLQIRSGWESRSELVRATPAILSWWPAAIAASAVGMSLLYGWWRLQQTSPGAAGPTAHVALIQGSLDTVFTELTSERRQQTYDHLRALTMKAAAAHPNLDLVIWPESMLVDPEQLVEEPAQSELPAVHRQRLQAYMDDFRRLLAGEAALANSNTDQDHPGTKLLVGTTTYVYGSSPPRMYNTALLADRAGNVSGRYYKMHPVMFGEYIPLGSALPWLYKLTPLGAGLSRGDGPEAFDVAGLKMSPSVCFESTIPHLIRRHLADLERRGTPADCLVNVTNDGWFWGTAILDLHLRCGVFRAVENRKPLLVAANTGISAWVDGSGVVRERGPRREPDFLLAAVQADCRTSPYSVIGDWPAWLCAAACVGLALVGITHRRTIGYGSS